MKPPWLPDWEKDLHKYPDPTKTSRLEWAWQFLRRNQEYQRLWAKLIQPHYDPADVGYSVYREHRRAGSQSAGYRPLHYLEDAGYQLGVFRQRFGIITVPPNPSEPRGKLQFAAQFIKHTRAHNVTTTLADHEVLMWFDLDRPIEPQVKNARTLLTETVAQKAFRFRPQQYSKYLRLLDAKQARAKTSHIAKVIYPQVKHTYPDYGAKHRIRADLKVAKRLRDRDFWRIAAGGEYQRGLFTPRG
jgi:hypothetical protein